MSRIAFLPVVLLTTMALAQPAPATRPAPVITHITIGFDDGTEQRLAATAPAEIRISTPATVPSGPADGTTRPATVPTAGPRQVIDFANKPGYSLRAGSHVLANLEIRSSYLPVSTSAATESLLVRDVTCVGAPDPGAKQSCFSFTSQAKSVTFERVRFVAPGGGWAVRSYSPKTVIRDCTFVSLPPANNCLIRLHAPADGSDMDLLVENNRVVYVPAGYPPRQADETIDAWIERLIAYALAHPDAGDALDVLTLSNGDGSGHAPGAGKFRGGIRNNTFVGGINFGGGIGAVEFAGNDCLRSNDPVCAINADGAGLDIHDNLFRDPGDPKWGFVAHAIKGNAPGRSVNNWYVNPYAQAKNAGPGVALITAEAAKAKGTFGATASP